MQYDAKEEADAAIQALGKKQCWGVTIEIDIFKKSSDRQHVQDKFTNLFVQGLDPQTTRDEFRDMFAVFGEIVSCTLKNNTDGIGFVSFVKPEDAQTALDKMNKATDPHNKIIIVSRFIPRHENQNQGQGSLSKIAQNMKSSYDNNIFINNLNMDVNEEQLREQFE